ncbi:hypothetical protein [Cellvibrio sp. UBA7671]|uniref:hypothetical protein n=1 Tax=Cellvibrio sp. UBA7671 TaxID=1946312 RepID=UPI002F35E5BD
MIIVPILESPYRKINFYMFIDAKGLLITSFFQVIAKPDISLGCFDTFDEASELLNYSHLFDGTLIEKPESFFIGTTESLQL